MNKKITKIITHIIKTVSKILDTITTRQKEIQNKNSMKETR